MLYWQQQPFPWHCCCKGRACCGWNEVWDSAAARCVWICKQVQLLQEWPAAIRRLLWPGVASCCGQSTQATAFSAVAVPLVNMHGYDASGRQLQLCVAASPMLQHSIAAEGKCSTVRENAAQKLAVCFSGCCSGGKLYELSGSQQSRWNYWQSKNDGGQASICSWSNSVAYTLARGTVLLQCPVLILNRLCGLSTCFQCFTI